MSMCLGKRKYPTKAKADYILNKAWKGAIRNGKDHDLPCRSYKCPTCHKYHLTSKAKLTKESNK